MKTLLKPLAASLAGLLALGASAAFAHGGHHGFDDRAARGDVALSVNVRTAHHRGYKPGHRASRIVNRDVFQTRFRARIVLVEEIVQRRRGPRLVCTVSVRGPEADYVSRRRVHRIADRFCSSRARVRVFA